MTSWDAFKPQTDQSTEDQSVSWSDYPKQFGSALADVGSTAAAGARYFYEAGKSEEGAALSQAIQDAFGKISGSISDTMTPEAKARVSATLTSEKFWEHPLSSSALKLTGMAPMVAASILPGGLIADAALAVGATAATGGVLNAASVVDEIYRKTDSLDDGELQKQSDYYAGLRSTFDEKEARRRYNQDLMGLKPAINLVVGAAAGTVGPAAKIVGGLKGASSAEGGRLAGAVIGGAEGAIGMGAQNAVADLSVQNAEIEGGLKKELDKEALVNSVLEGVAFGGVLGGAAGAAARTGRSARNSKVAEGSPEQPARTGTADVAAPPPDNIPVGNPDSTPVRSETQYPKVEAKKDRNRKAANKTEVTAVEAGAPSPDEAIAIAEKQQPPTRTVPDAAVPESPPVDVVPPVRPEPTPEIETPRAPEATPVVTPEVMREPAPARIDAPPAIEQAVTPPIVEAPRVVPESTPVDQPVRTGRILKAIKSPEEERAIAAANEEAAARMAKNAKQVIAEERGEVAPAGKHWTKEERAARAGAAEAARRLFEEHVPEDVSIPTTPTERAALRARLDALLRAADDAKIKVPAKVGYDGTSDHIVYLRAAKDLHRKLGQRSFAGQRARDQIQSFLVAERAAKQGDFAVLRDMRRVEGDLAMRRDQGDVDTKAAAPAGSDAEADAVQTKIPKSARGAVRIAASEDRPPSPVRKIALTEEAKREAMESFARAEAKAKGQVNTTRLDEIVRPKTPEATSAKVVERAANKTNIEPSDAQKKAGNYAKGAVKWNGLEIAIENPKGSRRSGKDPSGREWSVEMPDHYGYIRRTAGADGDQVDVYVGPNPKSEKVYVVEQRDLRTEKFDEHKALVGYDGLTDAMSAYDRAFSDGRGFERIKDIQEMSVDEFKAWVKSDKPKKAKREHERIDQEILAREDTTTQPDMMMAALQRASGPDAKPIHVTTMGDALRSLDLSVMPGVTAKIAPFVQRRLYELISDTPVYVLSEHDMARVLGRNPLAGEQGPRGFYVPVKVEDKAAGHRPFIAIRADQVRDPSKAAHVVIHEAIHAATRDAIEADPRAKATIRALMDEVSTHIERADNGSFDHVLHDILGYSLKNEHEFIAEVFSNPEVQDALARIDVSPRLAERLGLPNQKLSLWQAFIMSVRKMVGLDGVPGTYSMLEAALKSGGDLFAAKKRADALDGFQIKTTSPARFAGENIHALESSVRDRINALIEKRPDLQDQEGRPWALKLRTFDQIAQAAEHYFGGNQVRKVADLVEMIRVKASDNLKAAEPLVSKLYELEKKYAKSTDGQPSMWEKFTSLVHDETMSGVFADRELASQAHLGKDALRGMWGKAQHADLARRYAEIPEDLRQARLETMKYFTDQQNAMSLGIIENRILKALGVEDSALARRIFEGTTTDADSQRLGPATLDLIKEAKELAKIEGPYFPLMRRGEYVVRAQYADLKIPAGARKVDDNVIEFSGAKARDEAIQFAKGLDTRPTIESIWVDKNTGEKHFPDGTRVTKQDIDAEQRFRVIVQDKHVEFFDTAKEARAAAAELEKAGLRVKGIEERRFEPGDRRADMLSTQMKQLVTALERRQGYKDMTPAQKNELVQTLNEASIRFLGSTRIQSRRLPRRYVEGASRDLTRNTLDYAQSVSAYLARLEHQPALETAMKDMREAVSGNENKVTSFGRSAIANEVERRIAASSAYDEGGAWNAVTKRMMTLSFLDKLFSPAFNIINSLQPTLVTMPVLSGRYGAGRSFEAMSRAYRDVSALHVVGKGAKDTLAKARNHETTSFIDDIKSRLTNPRERAMLDYLAERGSIDPESGMEISRLIKSRDGVMGRLDTGLGYLEGIARQMPQAIEAINRTVTALAAYRLEIGRGASHEAATRFAQETVNNTQGLYSATNAPAIFNHPVAKLSLQFKKYGQLMYSLIGSNIGRALRNAEPGERAEALKTLAGIAATHTAMAGALGLPTEPFKYLLMSAQAAGLTSTGWNDVEDKVRGAAANYFGKTGGELLTRGLPRAIGIDVSSRVGLDSLLTFGEPRSTKEADVKSWLFQTLAGAPAALVGDWVKGANALTEGNFTRAAELMVPMKFAADSIRAYRQATEGKKSGTGRDTLSAYTPFEAAVRSIGFTPRREAEDSARRSAFFSAQKQSSGERADLMNKWITAKPAEKTKAFAAIRKWNSGQPKDAQISMADLTKAAKRRKTEESDGTVTAGVRTTKRDRHIFERANQTYN